MRFSEGTNRQWLADQARTSYEDGEYDAAFELKSLSLARGTRPASDTRLLTLQAEVEVKAGRALREDEGLPIERILTPGRSSDHDRPTDIHAGAEA